MIALTPPSFLALQRKPVIKINKEIRGRKRYQHTNALLASLVVVPLQHNYVHPQLLSGERSASSSPSATTKQQATLTFYK